MSGEGKFFTIRSDMNDKVVDIDGGQANPGARVQMWEFNGGDNQIFFEDRAAKVIRCKQNPELVIGQEGDHLEVQHCQEGDYNQQFEIRGDKVAKPDGNDVFDIAGADGENGARICVYDSHGGDNQRFRIDYSYPRYCVIRSRMNNKVLDVEGASGDPGAKVIMWEYNGGDNQMWWEDKHGYIHSKMTGYVLDWSNESDMRVNEQQHGRRDQEFVLSGPKICRRDDPGQCLDIAGEDDSDGAYLCCYDSKGTSNQQWDVEYLN